MYILTLIIHYLTLTFYLTQLYLDFVVAYSPTSATTLAISYKQMAENGHVLNLSVRDTHPCAQCRRIKDV